MLQRLFFLFIFLLVTCAGAAQKNIPGRYNSITHLFETTDSTYWIGFFNDGVARIVQNGYVGLIDSTGTVLAEPQYEKIYDFEGRVARVTSHGKYGIIDRKGRVVLKPFTRELQEFKKGIAVYRSEVSSWLYGLVSEEGKFITKANYNHIGDAKDNRYLFSKDSVLGLLSPKGKEIVILKSRRPFDEFEYSPLKPNSGLYHLQGKKTVTSLFEFHEGLTQSIALAGKQFKIGAIDTNGREIIAPRFDWIDSFYNGYAAAAQGDKWGLIDRTGQVKIPFIYKSLQQGENGKFIVTNDKGRSGLVDVNGKELLPLTYEGMTYLFDDLYAVHNRANWGVISEKAGEVLPCKFDAVIAAGDNNGIAVSYVSNYSLNTGIPRYIYIGAYFYFDGNGKTDKKTYPFSKLIEGYGDWYVPGSATVRVPGFFAPALKQFPDGIPLSATEGAIINGVQYDYAQPVKGGYTIVGNSIKKDVKNELPFGYRDQTRWKKGIVDAGGKMVVPLIYDEIQNEGLPLFIVKNGEKFGVISPGNEIIIPVEFNNITIFNGGILVCREAETVYHWNRGVRDFYGRELLPYMNTDLHEIEQTGQWMTGYSTSDLIDKKGNKVPWE